MEKMNRRKLLKGSSFTGAAMVVGNLLRGKSGWAYGRSDTIGVPETQIPVAMKTDVVVVGGGPAGFGAAMRAARAGVNTLLIERFGGPGGAATSGWMCTVGEGGAGKLHDEWADRMRREGWIFDAWKKYPQLAGNVLCHGSGRMNFYPDDGAYMMIRMLEEAKVKLLVRTLFVDAIVHDNFFGDDSIEAVVVENASGRQAIRGKIFIDATGRADVVARTGCPYKSAGNQDGLPVPFSLMYRIGGVDYAKLFEYQKSDPALQTAIAKGRAAGDIPDGLYMPYQYAYGGGPGGYDGCPQLNMMALRAPGDMLVWSYIPYRWGLNAAENGFDASRGEIEMRKFNFAEVKFLRKYVPGFENAFLSGVAPYMALREGRHPQGEYIITYEDMVSNRRFPDAVLRRTATDELDWSDAAIRTFTDMSNGSKRHFSFDVPYRAFLPKKINNLILAGECLSCSWECIVQALRLIPWCMRTGEVAGESAAIAVKKGISAKEVKWSGYFTDPEA
jgi:hypothetical protein